MSEYLHVEKPFLDQPAALGRTVIDPGAGMHPLRSGGEPARDVPQWLLPEVFRDAVRSLNRTAGGTAWLTGRQLATRSDPAAAEP